MLEQFVRQGRPAGPQRFHCPFEVDRVPQHDGVEHQIGVRLGDDRLLERRCAGDVDERAGDVPIEDI